MTLTRLRRISVAIHPPILGTPIGILRTEQSLINELVREAIDQRITILGNGVLSEADNIDILWRNIGVITRYANVATNTGHVAYGKIELDKTAARE